MKKKRRVRKNRRNDYLMYGLTFAFCMFTVAMVIWLVSGGRAGDIAGNIASGQDGKAENADTGRFQHSGDGMALPESSNVIGRREADAGTGSNMQRGAGEEDSAGTAVTGGKVSAGAASESGGFDVGAAEEKPEITLVMVGDILLHTPVAESGKREDGGYDFSAVFDEMEEKIATADLALVNQEVIIGGEDLGVSGYPAFNAPYELGDALVDAGFDVVLHATNHALDKGRQGIFNCLSFWEETHPDIAVLGIHGSAADQEEIYVYEQEGIRLAILNYTYGTNGIALPEDMPYAVDLLDRERVADDLQRARELADFVVVCPHWGTEYVLEETAQQREWAAFFAENGAWAPILM